MAKEKKLLKPLTQPETPVKLNMTFEQAMKKALSTPLPKKDKPKKGK